MCLDRQILTLSMTVIHWVIDYISSKMSIIGTEANRMRHKSHSHDVAAVESADSHEESLVCRGDGRD